MESEGESSRCVVRSLRTTHRKLKCAKPAHHTLQYKDHSLTMSCMMIDHEYIYSRCMITQVSSSPHNRSRSLSAPVVQRHTPWNSKARACGVWCEIFAPQTAKSQGETPPFVLLHHGMTEAFSGGCNTSILTSPCVMHDDSS